MILFTAIALIVAGVISTALDAGRAGPDILAATLRLASPDFLIWVVLALALGFIPGRDAIGRAWMATVAAVIASIAGTTVNFGSIAFLTTGGLIALVILGFGVLGFASAVTIGSFGAAVFVVRRGDSRPRAVGAIGVVLLLALGAGAVSALVAHWFSVYFSISSSPRMASVRDGEIYVRSAAVAVAVPIVALVIALFVRARSLVILCAVFIVGLSLAALIFAIPQNRFVPHHEIPTPKPANSNYHPCYSGSNDCVGG